MQLESLKISALHGGINLDINFNKDMTLLVGINGSGKTSALNAIDWLLKPNLQKLAITEYKELLLTFTEDNETYKLSAIKDKQEVTISIHGESIDFAPIKIPLIHPEEISESDHSAELYSRLQPEKHELPIWDFLKSLTPPTVITLDRTITAEAEEIIFFETAVSPRQKKSRHRSPLAHVKEVTAEKYSEYRKIATRNDDELKARIVMSALQNPELIFNDRPIKPMTPTEIKQLENKVIEYLSTAIKAEEVTSHVKAFFASSKMLTKRTNMKEGDNSLLLEFVISQYRQLENLAKAFNDYELKNAAAFKSLQEYLDAVNGFFNDSSKVLYFDDSNGRLVFSFLNSSGSISDKKPVDHLSSGERQILILFTFLAFVAKEGGVFIVDEPELSLHPKWQHEFMESFLRVCPKNTQLLLATHSPDIVGRFKSSCIPLKRKENA